MTHPTESPSSDAGTDLDIARILADAADAITLPAFRKPDLLVATKADRTPVTAADRAAEAELRAILGRLRPDDIVLGEEEGGAVADSGRGWIIDPIDGTKNYIRGVPVWASLIAAVSDGRVVAGMVSAPALGRRWWAAVGRGAWTQGIGDDRPHRMRASGVETLADASFSFSDGVGWPPDALARLMSRTWRTRAYGDFWSHVLVAEGAVDIAAEPELNAWDVAALIPIVEEAGGRITTFTGGDPLRAPADGAVTTNGLVHEEVLAALVG